MRCSLGRVVGAGMAVGVGLIGVEEDEMEIGEVVGLGVWIREICTLRSRHLAQVQQNSHPKAEESREICTEGVRAQ